MSDLFDNRTDKQKLHDWAKEKFYVKTSDVIRWGTQNFSNRALRNMQQLSKDGHFRRLTDEEKASIFGNIKEDAWRRI